MKKGHKHGRKSKQVKKLLQQIKKLHGPNFNPKHDSYRADFYSLQFARELHATKFPKCYTKTHQEKITWGTLANDKVMVKASSVPKFGNGLFAKVAFPECDDKLASNCKSKSMADIYGNPSVICEYSGDYFTAPDNKSLSPHIVTTHVASFDGQFKNGLDGLPIANDLVCIGNKDGSYQCKEDLFNHIGIGCMANSAIPGNACLVTIPCKVKGSHTGKKNKKNLGSLVIERLFLVAITQINIGDEIWWDYTPVI